jgi:hypothetical protein
MHDDDGIARSDDTRFQHDAHDAGLSHKFTFRRAIQHGSQQARFEVFDLSAGVAKARYAHGGVLSDAEDAALSQREQRQTHSSDVLAHLTGRYAQALFCQFIEKLLVEEVYLT